MEGLGRGCLPEGALEAHLASAEEKANATWAASAESALAWYAWANEQLLALVPKEQEAGPSAKTSADKPDSVTDAQAALRRLASFESSALADKWRRTPASLGPVALSRRGWCAVDKGPDRMVCTCSVCGAALEFPSDSAWKGLLPWEATSLVSVAPLEALRKTDALLSTDGLSLVKGQVVSAHFSGCPWREFAFGDSKIVIGDSLLPARGAEEAEGLDDARARESREDAAARKAAAVSAPPIDHQGF